MKRFCALARMSRCVASGSYVPALTALIWLMVSSSTLLPLAGQTASPEAGPAKGASFPPDGWSRTQGAPLNSNYVGGQVCTGCHSTIVEAQRKTPMAHASTAAARSAVLQEHPELTFQDGPYELRIDRQGDQEIYSAREGDRKVSAPLLWAFGQGVAGQTYIYQKNGAFYESRVSYYPELGGLDLTTGHPQQVPPTLAESLGRPLSGEEVGKCFGCHTSEDVFAGKLELSRLQTGVTCENCHGPGSRHVEAHQPENFQTDGSHEQNILNPANMSTSDLNEFCGTCHRSASQVLSARVRGILNVRFQPYRLESSRCFDPSDKRISCLACHDPHVKLVTDSQSYDAKCLACHQNENQKRTSARRAPACPTATSNCASCHMPKLALPGAHYKFTDHYIRIYRANAPYPD